MQAKILLVDDREDNLLSIEAILEKDGYRFVKANSGRAALKILLKEYDFALILMDVKMPNLNGFETASLIYEREKLRHIPIVFITANNYGDENIYKGYKAGAVDYIYKPIKPELLKAKVAVFVELYKKNHKLVEQERKLIAINKNLESEIKERKASEEKVKQLNTELLQNIARLESANRDLDRFAFMASHDLREPLRKILIFSDRLLTKYREPLAEEGQMCINRIEKSAERMQALIEDILSFSKVTVEKESLEKSNLNEMMNDVMEEMEGIVQSKNAKVIIDDLPSLYVQPRLMRSVFHNLINNALKYTRPYTEPVVKVYSEIVKVPLPGNTQDNGNKYCRIFVEDNGIGFDQKYAEEIFGMFKRLHLNGEFEGTGIGLALCKKIVEQHNGFISAKSEVDAGSTFMVSLPMVGVTETLPYAKN